MKHIPGCILLLFMPFTLSAQNVDLTKNGQSADRVAILNILRSKVKPSVKQDVKFIVRSLQLNNNFAFLKGDIKGADGGEIDFRKTAFKEQYEAGMFDGGSIYALLKKKNGKWVHVTHAIGPTDVVYACWAQQYKAPKVLFDVNENCGF